MSPEKTSHSFRRSGGELCEAYMKKTQKKQTGRKAAQVLFILAFMAIGGFCGVFLRDREALCAGTGRGLRVPFADSLK